MFIYADKSHMDDLIEIWQESFGDSDQYIRMFLTDNFDKIKIPAYEFEGRIISVAYLLPVTYCDGLDSELPCYYLYAAATHPKHRGKGCFAQLLSYIEESIPEPIFLVPGEKSLAEYYKKQGLVVWQEESKLPREADIRSWSDKLDTEAGFQEILPHEYAGLREQFLGTQPHIKWEEHFIKYICKENHFCGGTQMHINYNGKEYLTLYRKTKDHIYVLEMISKDGYTYVKPEVLASKKMAYLTRGYFNLTMG